MACVQFRREDRKSRVGAPTTNMMHDKGLSTNIGWQNKDAYGRSLSSDSARRCSGSAHGTNGSVPVTPRSATSSRHGEIDRIASALGLPQNVRATSSVIYRRALGDDLLPGRSIEGVATAALYAAARMAGNPRSLDEMARVSRVEKMELTRTYRYIVRELSLEVQPADPEHYLPRFISDLDLRRRPSDGHGTSSRCSSSGTLSGKRRRHRRCGRRRRRVADQREGHY